MNNSRRNFLRSSAFLGTGIVATEVVSAQHEGHTMPKPQAPKKADSAQPQAPPKGDRPPAPAAIVPVVTPDVPKLPWRMENGVKVFRLTAEVVKREFLPANPFGPAKVVDAWCYSGSLPGPTIEVNEGDRVRVIFQNKLPEETTVHWHGLEVPINMDGVPHVSQPPVKPGETFVYEFTLHQNGTYFYHSHAAMQEMMGMIGLFIIHPRKPYQPAVHKDFGLIVQEWAVLPNSTIPNTMSMEFNWLTFNGKAGPAATPMIVKLGERVRIRLVNLGMDHHPIHIHGMQFHVTGTEGGRSPESTWFPGNTVIVGVAQSRDIEFDAVFPGDWMLHCHLPHHMMNQMVSMVGPMAHVGHGMHTGMGMEEGMGMIREGNALSENLGPGMGRGMGIATDRERAISNAVGSQQMEGQKMSGQTGQHVMPMDPQMEAKKRVPGFPQDDMMMMMVMDEAIAKPETNGLAPGWSSAFQGMMTMVRVLPPDQYEKLMADIREGRIEKGQKPAEHKHNE